MKSSGIGGQAVLEGVMMRHKEDIAVAVRKSDGSIEIGKQKAKSPTANHRILGLPIIRGVVSFIFSLVVGMKTLMFSADFDEILQEEEEQARKEKEEKKKKKKSKNAESGMRNSESEGNEELKGNPECEDINAEAGETAGSADEAAGALKEAAEEPEKADNRGKITETNIEDRKSSAAETTLLGVTMVIALIIAIALFVFLPYWVSDLIVRFTGLGSPTLLAIIEGFIKLAIFIGYVAVISKMEDIKRTFMYHGAEHKCINCIESGKELTVENVMASSKEHRRCGTSFVFFVLIISIIFFIFIRVDNRLLRIVIRFLLIPVIAGVSYEFIQWAGNSDSKIAAVLSKPGLWVQALTTKEPTPDMAEVGIASVEAVFDWRGYLRSQGIEVADPEENSECGIRNPELEENAESEANPESKENVEY